MNAISKEPRRRSRSRRLKAAVAVAVVALVPTMLSTTPAEGTVVNVAEGHNITVFHNIDFVAVFGYTLGESLTVEVFRGGRRSSAPPPGTRRARHPRSDSRSTTAPRVCPSPATAGRALRRTSDPVITSVVTSLSGVDEVIVDRIRFTARGPRALRNGDIVVPFNAFRANGDPDRAGVHRLRRVPGRVQQPGPLRGQRARRAPAGRRAGSGCGCATGRRSAPRATGPGGTRPSCAGPCWVTDTRPVSATSRSCPQKACSSTA